MKAICGAAPVALTGDITYNGHTAQEFNVTRTVRAVPVLAPTARLRSF